MNPIRVMVVDDSVVVRKIVTDVLSADPDIEVVGTAVNGRIAVAKLEQLKPDLVTMDIEMPEMNGIEAVRAIRAAGGPRSRVPIIMFSTLTERGASATLDALSAGANEYVTKPANVGSVGQSMESVREQLDPQDQGAHRPPGHRAAPPRAAAPVRRRARRAPRTGPRKKPAVLVIGSSTGGPEALARVLPLLPASLPRAGAARPAHAAGLHPPVRPAAGPAQPAARGRGHRRQRRCARAPCTSPPATTTSSSRAAARGLADRPQPGPAGELLPARRRLAVPLRRRAPTAAPCSASCSPAWAPTAARRRARSAPPAAPSSSRTRPPRSSGACPARSPRPASPTRSSRSDRIAEAITAPPRRRVRRGRAGAILAGGTR